jgi:hypothetical protein
MLNYRGIPISVMSETGDSKKALRIKCEVHEVVYKVRLPTAGLFNFSA